MDVAESLCGAFKFLLTDDGSFDSLQDLFRVFDFLFAFWRIFGTLILSKERNERNLFFLCLRTAFYDTIIDMVIISLESQVNKWSLWQKSY